MQQGSHKNQLQVLALIALGLIVITLCIVLGLFIDNNGMPNWAENVLVATGTACTLKLGDCISALIQLSTGRQVENLGTRLANSAPAPAAEYQGSAAAGDAADAVADAAVTEADKFKGNPE